MSDVQSTLFAVIARTAAVDVSTINPGSTIKDFGIPSLEVIEMLFELEDQFDVQLSEREVDMATGTVADLVAAIERGLAAKASKVNAAHHA
jgi:acyl carrier protein